ncbi:tetratricopeptide repeat protein [Rhodocytophaga aerolata]|uniref:Tetratricopeptide repeat protein n=1 Tax=Rhodocytophaga aerolata TaxID=455078 RepID=A0ABT8RGK2_9BACT|nr:tetratricopeptide repeat protein [Rhodocytophaga aerolata]MDO1451233.1 tetratricopeptide repeat protein [Rhodocytophaga aerolata]
MNKKLLFAFLSKHYFYLLPIALLFYQINNEQYHILANCIIHYLLLLLFFKVGVIIHELGHAIFGLAVKAHIYRIIFGRGEELLKFNLFKVPAQLYSNLNSGAVLISYRTDSNIRLNHFMTIIGGPLFTLICIVAGMSLHDFHASQLLGLRGLSILNPFVIANMFLLINVLVPTHVYLMGVKTPTDGLALLTIFFSKQEKVQEMVNRHELLQALDLYEQKQYRQALDIYESYITKYPEDLPMKAGIANMYLKMEDFRKAYEIFLEVYEPLSKDKLYRSYVNNGLSWNYLLFNDQDSLILAEKYSDLAYREGKLDPSIISTRGSVLIERGKTNAGIDILNRVAKLDECSKQSLASCMYLALGHFQLKEVKAGKKYLKFVETNINQLDPDEKYLFVKVKEKIAVLQGNTIVAS